MLLRSRRRPGLIPGGIVRVVPAIAVAVAAVVLAGCAAGEPTTYGPTVAGPTIVAKSSAPVAPPSLPADEQPVNRVSGKSLCALFSSADISSTLGLKVGKVAVSKQGPYSVCTWKAAKGDGTVTITRAPGNYYPAFENKIVAAAKARKARGRKDLDGIADQAFAIGASVSGVPIWYGAALLGGVLTGVELSGAGSQAGIATIKGFLIEILARG
jgi:hypothetical protein